MRECGRIPYSCNSIYTFCMSCTYIYAFWKRIVTSIAFRKGLEIRVKPVTHTFTTAQRPCTFSLMPVTDHDFTFSVLGCSTMMSSSSTLKFPKPPLGSPHHSHCLAYILLQFYIRRNGNFSTLISSLIPTALLENSFIFIFIFFLFSLALAFAN